MNTDKHGLLATKRHEKPQKLNLRCREVREHLAEWVERSLAAQKRVRIEEHGAVCGECGRVLKEAREGEARMRGLFLTAADSMHVRPAFEGKLVRALRAGAGAASEAERIGWFGLWRFGFGVAVGVIFLGLLVWRLEEQPGGSQAFATSEQATVQSPSRATVAYVLPDYSFREEGNLVWDSITYRTNVLDLTLWAQRKSETKKEL